MQKIKTKIQHLGFNSNHAVLLGVVVFVFLALSVSSLDIKVFAMFAKAEDVKIVTYDEAKRQVYAEAGLDSSSEKYLEETKNQYALLDRGTVDGKVLGEAIGIGEIPDANEMVLPELAQTYPIELTQLDNELTQREYLENLSNLENSHGVVSLMATLNSDDKQLLSSAVVKINALLSELSNLNVPASLKEYHQAKIGNYFAMMKMGQIYSGQLPNGDLQLYLKAMLAYGSKINQFEGAE